MTNHMGNTPYFDPFSFSKDFAKVGVGFDPILKRFLDVVSKERGGSTTYPPYNITKNGETSYTIQLAVAGFDKNDIDITLQDGKLKISGSIPEKNDGIEYLYKGIAGRTFARVFEIADGVEIESAELVNGILSINLRRIIPEEKKAKRIEISDGNGKSQLLTEKTNEKNS